MTKTTYKIISAIPLIGTLFDVLYMPKICSPMMEQFDFSELELYKACHPNEVVTKGLFNQLIKPKG